jgi:[ribosomal protein S5]-alanine N-acetyltransferase
MQPEINYLLTGQESDRLLFRKLEDSDFDVWLEFFKNPLSNQYWQFDNPDPVHQCKVWFDKNYYRYNNNKGGMNVLINKLTGGFVGQCGLLIQVVDGVEELEVAYSIMPQHWGNGYATEAAAKCIDHTFSNCSCDSLIAIIAEKNRESQNVALKNKMIFEKRTVYGYNPVWIYRLKRSTESEERLK